MKNQYDQFRHNLVNATFSIPLKSADNVNGLLNEASIRALEHEYATKYLESLNIDPTTKNIKVLLKSKPFSKCKIECVNNIIKIQPNQFV